MKSPWYVYGHNNQMQQSTVAPADSGVILFSRMKIPYLSESVVDLDRCIKVVFDKPPTAAAIEELIGAAKESFMAIPDTTLLYSVESASI